MSLNQTASNATLIYAKSPQRKIMILRLLFLYRLASKFKYYKYM